MTPCRFTPRNDPVPIVQEAGWAPGSVWTGAENLFPTGFRSPDRPARSKLLYQLSCPGPSFTTGRRAVPGGIKRPGLSAEVKTGLIELPLPTVPTLKRYGETLLGRYLQSV